VRGQRAAHLLRSISAVVQAKTVTSLLGSEAVAENSDKILGKDADAVVAYLDAYVLIVSGDTETQLARRRGRVFQRVLGV